MSSVKGLSLPNNPFVFKILNATALDSRFYNGDCLWIRNKPRVLNILAFGDINKVESVASPLCCSNSVRGLCVE
jgi:hypothetical protein